MAADVSLSDGIALSWTLALLTPILCPFSKYRRQECQPERDGLGDSITSPILPVPYLALWIPDGFGFGGLNKSNPPLNLPMS